MPMQFPAPKPARDAALAATAETNAARLALRGNDMARATALLTQAVDTLGSLPPSYANGMALVSAGSAVFERQGEIPADAQAVAERAFRAAAAMADTLRNSRFPRSPRAASAISTSGQADSTTPRP